MYKLAIYKYGRLQISWKGDWINYVNLHDTKRGFRKGNVDSIDALTFKVFDYTSFKNNFGHIFTDYTTICTKDPELRKKVYYVIINVKFGYTDRFAVQDIYEQMVMKYPGVFDRKFSPYNSFVPNAERYHILEKEEVKFSYIDMLYKLIDLKIVPKYSALFDAQQREQRFYDSVFDVGGIEVTGYEFTSFPMLFIKLGEKTKAVPQEVDKMLTIKKLHFFQRTFLSQVIPFWGALIESGEVKYGVMPNYITIKDREINLLTNVWKHKHGDEWFSVLKYPIFTSTYSPIWFVFSSCLLDKPDIFYSKKQQVQNFLSSSHMDNIYIQYLREKYG